MSHLDHGLDGASTIRVTHLVKGLGPGGAERLVLNQLLTTGGGISYSVLRLIAEKEHLEADVVAAGAEVEVLPKSLLADRLGVSPAGLAQSLRRLQPDIIHAHSPVLAAQARLLTRAGIVKALTVTTEHNRWQRHHRATRAVNRLTAPLDAARFAVSEDVLESMDSRLTQSTVALEHGLPIDSITSLRSERERVRAELGISPETVAIGIVANFRPEKAYDVFLSAAMIAAEEEPKLTFVVVGQGPGEQAFRRAVDQSAQPEMIQVLGYRSDATEVMSAFDVFTLSSRHEGKPVSIMEAMALGLPVAATRAGGIPEMVSDGKTGRLVEIDDSSGLAAAYIELARDQAARESFGAAGASVASERFDASRSTKSIESVYRDLTSTVD